MAEEDERAVWDNVSEHWEEMSEEAQESHSEEGRRRREATELRLNELSNKLETEKSERLKNGNWSVMGVFWMFAIFAAFGLIGIAWDAGFAYAMELKFVKGQAWLAGVVVIFAGFVITGLIGSIWESITESRAKKS